MGVLGVLSYGTLGFIPLTSLLASAPMQVPCHRGAIEGKLDFPKGRGANFKSTATAQHQGGQFSAVAAGPAVGSW